MARGTHPTIIPDAKTKLIIAITFNISTLAIIPFRNTIPIQFCITFIIRAHFLFIKPR